MALTAYCKKCNREVAPGEVCPRCGTKLAKSATHAAWVVERRPVADWMCWNAVMRWLLPAGLAVLLLSLLLEGLSGGMEAVERLFLGSFPVTLLWLFCAGLALVALALGLQGKELMDYVVDSRGVHATRYLPHPTPLRLLARGKSPALMREVNPEAENPVLRLEERDLPWRNVSRVQLWPEKCYILFYAPAWWLRIPVRATPFSWDDALYFVKDKLGKKKAVELPEHLRTQAPKKPASPRRSPGRSGTVPSGSAQPSAYAAPEAMAPSMYSGGNPAEPQDAPWGTEPAEDAAAMSEDDVPGTVGEQMSFEEMI